MARQQDPGKTPRPEPRKVRRTAAPKKAPPKPAAPKQVYTDWAMI